MSCNCSKAQTLPSCLTALVIGEVDTAFDYYVYMRTATGRVDRYEAANVYGTQLIAIEPDNLRINTVYEVWVTKQDADGIEDRATFTVGETELTCVEIEFNQVFDGTTIEYYESQTITLNE